MDRETAQALEKIGWADFLVRIVYRQNASWQGEVHWLNTDQKKCFRSFLELTLLLNQCLEESAYPRGGYAPRSWDDSDDAGRKDRLSQP